MESLQEQIEYGGYCVHGTNIDTPGGADLMCGDCEAGYTVRTFCTECGTDLWLTHSDVLVGCEPNPARTEFAQDVRKIRNERNGQAPTWLLPIVARQQQVIQKRIHDIRRNIGEIY